MIEAEAILFDWDGTLLDSFPAGYRASITVLRRLGLEVDRKRFLETYSPNWYESYRMLGVPEEEWSNADALWRETYRMQEAPLFPFVEQLLTRLDEAGYALGLVTSGNRTRVEEELHRFGLEAFFSATVCFEDTHEKKPNPEPLVCAIDALNTPARSCVYVGDRPEDIEMGRRVGTYTVGVESEYGSRALIEQAAPDLVLAHAGLLADRFGL